MREERQHLERQLEQYRRNLRVFEGQIAEQGGPSKAGIDLLNATDETRHMIADLQQRLAPHRVSYDELAIIDDAARTQVILAYLQAQDRRYADSQQWQSRRDWIIFWAFIVESIAIVVAIILAVVL